jgi:S-adenosylmethionine:tRNA ribosyltransferase-isomerase
MSFPLHLSTHVGGELWIAEPRAPVAAGERAALADGGGVTFLAQLDAAHPRLWYTALAIRKPVEDYLARHGTPIRYRYVTEALPLGNYQTIFARVPGSAEMPSAGRPFSRRVLDDLHQAGIAVASVTLHTGVSSPERHERPYRERFDVSAQTAAAVNATRLRGGRVVAVGTTVVRALESVALPFGHVEADAGWTRHVVTPASGVRVVDGLLTGWHDPDASHLLMLEAIAGRGLVEDSYEAALEAGYRWHEFGDVHLILPQAPAPSAA